MTFAVARVVEGNRALAEARAEVARLGAENERTRIARDLHDLLGHSLTTITVKAGLARRLGETDPARARQEIAEVEELSRQALSDVRNTVANYHEVSLAGELARGKELLRSSGITVDVPTATDTVDVAHQELFGWVVREGLTNVARHAQPPGAPSRWAPRRSRSRDDGIGGPVTPAMVWPGSASGSLRPGASWKPARCGRVAGGSGWRSTDLASHPHDDPVAARRRPGARTLRPGCLAGLEEDFEVVASVGRGDKVVDVARTIEPDVALLDIEMPGLDGLAAAAVLSLGAPHLQSRSS